MPMLKKYSDQIPLPKENIKTGPSEKTLMTILNYSKSVKVAVVQDEKILVHLN